MYMNTQDNKNQEFIYQIVAGKNGSFSISASSPTTWSAALTYTDARYEPATIVVEEVLSMSEALQAICELYDKS